MDRIASMKRLLFVCALLVVLTGCRDSLCARPPDPPDDHTQSPPGTGWSMCAPEDLRETGDGGAGDGGDR